MKSNKMVEGVFPPRHAGLVPQELGRWFANLAEAGLLVFSGTRARSSNIFYPDPEEDVDPEDWETKYYYVVAAHVREPTQLIFCGEWLVYPMWGTVACHAYDITHKKKPSWEQCWFDMLTDSAEWFCRPGMDIDDDETLRCLLHRAYRQ